MNADGWLHTHGYTWLAHLDHLIVDPADMRLAGPVPARVDGRVVFDPDPTPYARHGADPLLFFPYPSERGTPQTVPVVIGGRLAVEAYPHQIVHARECASTTCITLWRSGQRFATTHPDRHMFRLIGTHAHAGRGWSGVLLDYPTFEVPGMVADIPSMASDFDSFWPLDDVADWALLSHRRDTTTTDEHGGPL